MDDIFSGGDHTPNDSNPLDLLVGEGKKYKTIEDLAKSRLEADNFIEQLKTENKGLRDDLATRARLEEVVDRLASRNSQEDHDDGDNHALDNESRQPAFTEKDLDKLLEAKITQKERERTAKENRQAALNELQRIYGNDASRILSERVEALGLDKEDINALAGKSPSALVSLISGKTSQERPFTPPRSSVTSPGTTTTNPEPGSWDYYQKLKKDNPSLYWSPKVQHQMHNDMIKKAREEGKI